MSRYSVMKCGTQHRNASKCTCLCMSARTYACRYPPMYAFMQRNIYVRISVGESVGGPSSLADMLSFSALLLVLHASRRIACWHVSGRPCLASCSGLSCFLGRPKTDAANIGSIVRENRGHTIHASNPY